MDSCHHSSATTSCKNSGDTSPSWGVINLPISHTVNETKPRIVNQQCVAYSFECDLCDACYVGYTRGYLHNRVKGHKQLVILRHCQTLQQWARDDASGPAKSFRSA